MHKTTSPYIYDANNDIATDGDNLVYRTAQEIPGFFLDDLADKRISSKTDRCGEYHHVASIPVAVVSEMYHRGIDFYNAPPSDIIKYLKKMGYGYLFATSKNITFQEN